MIRGQAGLLFNHSFGVIEDFARHQAAIDHHKSNSRITVVEHQTTCLQFIVNVGGLVIAESAIDRHTEPRRNVARCRTGPQLLYVPFRGESRLDWYERER